MSKPKVTEADRLKHPCPECQAGPGEPCRMYNLRPLEKAHRARGPGQLRKKMQAEADRRTARVKASYGPLFAEVADREVKAETAEDIWERRRRGAAFGAESESLCEQANEGMEALYVRWAFRKAAELIGRDAAERLWVHAVRVYGLRGKESYLIGSLRTALTSRDEICLRHGLRFDPARINQHNRDGRHLVDEDSWPPLLYAPPLTREGFDRMFRRPDHRDGVGRDAPEPDGQDELFRSVMAKLGAEPSGSPTPAPK